MSTLDEVIAAARADIAALDEARGEIESTKAKVEQTHQQAAVLGSERLSLGAQSMRDSCEQALRQIVVAKEKLREVISQTQRLKAYEPGSGASVVTVHPTKGEVDVGHLDTEAIVGDPVRSPEGGPNEPGSLRKELSSTDDGDRSKSRLQRLGRAMARNANDFQSQAKDYAKPAANVVGNGYNPQGQGGTTTQASVESSRHQSTVSSDSQSPQVVDAVGAAVVMGVVALEGISRLVKRGR